jgi:hypothetical protein
MGTELELLIARRDDYVTRLDAGMVKIEEARNEGKDVSKWENFWSQLLMEYEKCCDRINELQKEQVAVNG